MSRRRPNNAPSQPKRSATAVISGCIDVNRSASPGPERPSALVMKGSMAGAKYAAELEKALTDLARKSAEIRALEGKGK